MTTRAPFRPRRRFSPPPTRSELLWDGVDFDGTICNNSGPPDFQPLEPIWDNVKKIQRLVDDGRKIWIFTARPWADYELIEAYLNHYGIPFHGIVCGKLLVARLFDDRAFNAALEDWSACNPG
ncbi:hypothetical protein GCM10012275_28600 [Longimycelium tulufanense]|uniref:Uncharacterized protein n=1 Tax=Longimycelium tulufanense TaxID=907463 RepID=A0A8J3CER1_9PSEU|nr:hypothetical protein [Longimycelium tulufanense]GGM55780.1 hypothetical protein GCM10012275_28600 [Longimycelium tulufanense]